MRRFRFLRNRLFATIIILTLQLTATSPASSAAKDTAVVEQGKYILHKFENPIGEETYRIKSFNDSLTVEMNFAFTDRGTRVPLTATFRCDRNFAPELFVIKGKPSRQSQIDDAVEVTPDRLRIRKRDTWSEIGVPPQYFPIAGYAPVTMQMLLVRYWSGHRRPGELKSILGGKVTIEPRGRDTLAIEGRREILSRYSVAGLIWGRETLWLDENLHLVAAVTTDAEFDHFEAVQERFRNALGTFVARAGADGMAVLAEMARTITGRRDGNLALVGGTLINGTGAAALQDAAVVVENGRITAVGPRSETRIPAGAQVIDVRGKSVLPGLWDMHAHFEQVEWGPIYLAAGVTTVRDCGNELEFITSVRDALARGRGVGPRILAAGIVDGSGPMAIGVERVDTPEQARAWTDRYHAAGFEQMKIYSSVKLEELRAVAAEAHRLGMSVTGHVPNGLNAYQVVEAGQDQINHLSGLFEILISPPPAETTKVTRLEAIAAIDVNSPEVRKAIDFFRQHGTVIDPTIALTELYTVSRAKPAGSFEPGISTLPPALAALFQDVDPPSPRTEALERMFRKSLEIVGALHRAGVTIVAGTDQAVPGHSLHREIELYVQAGFTPMEAIQAATIVPAQVMGLNKELGTLEAGKRGDIIIVDGNPLEDIRSLRNVKAVIANGVMYDAADLWKSVDFRP
jgi:imidazolonepropionase-like amidohydrolase